jgi:lysine 6-dehydrogenase
MARPRFTIPLRGVESLVTFLTEGKNERMRILVLGAGRMGYGATFDLARTSEVEAVTVADIDLGLARRTASRLSGGKVKPVQADVNRFEDIAELMRGHDAAISCVVYKHNLSLARAAIEAGVNFCDLGGNNAVVDAELRLDKEARRAGINIIPDCGLAPGMASVLVAHGAARFEHLDEVYIRVGGLPVHPREPLNYQLVFSVDGLINEYVERARVIRDYRIVEVDSMTELEQLSFPAPFESMEAFQTSGGVSTLPETLLGRVKELDYKTIRYPGHCERFKLLIDLGLASSDPVAVAGVEVAPRAVLSELLVKHLPADEPDVVLIRVEFRGLYKDRRRSLVYDIIDYYDDRTGLSAMMRMTAFPASIIAQMMARGDIKEKGAIPQERCVPPVPFVAALEERGIKISERLTDH